MPIDISEKNETKLMHRKTFRASNTVNKECILSVAMRTVRYQMGRRFIFDPIFLRNEFDDLNFFCIKTFRYLSVINRQLILEKFCRIQSIYTRKILVFLVF